MNESLASNEVRCWQEQVTIPTYPVQEADPNPMFLEKWVYQGSRGKVYPNPLTDRVALEKVDANYKAIFLENEFIQLMILPEIGGALGNDAAGHTVLISLAEFTGQLARTEPKIDYFATFQPNLLLFDDDLSKKNRVEAALLGALAGDGLGDAKTAMRQLEQVLTEDPNHLFAAEMRRWLKIQRRQMLHVDEGRTAL